MLTVDSARRRARDEDAGATLVELVVALVILATVVTLVAGVLISTLQLVKSNTQRTAATNLAAQQIEKVRAMLGPDIPVGQTNLGTVTVGGTAYSLVQDAAYASQSATGNACNGPSASLPFKRVTVTVTWPNMGAVQPVRSDTLRVLGVGNDILSGTTGAAAVAVQGGDGGQPVASIAVTLKTSPGGGTVATQVTGYDGCVVFANLPVGNYTASVNTLGHVSQDGAQDYTGAAFGVTTGNVTKAVLPYDRLGGLSATLTSPNGFPTPITLGLTLTSSVWAVNQDRVFVDCAAAPSAPQGCVAGPSREASSLFPGDYGSWAGTCTDAKPAGVIPLDAVTAGSVTNVPVSNLRDVQVTGDPSIAGSQTLYAVHASGDPTCPSGEYYDLGTLTAGGVVDVALPIGDWRLQLSSAVPATFDPSDPQSVRLTSANSAPTPVVVSS